MSLEINYPAFIHIVLSRILRARHMLHSLQFTPKKCVRTPTRLNQYSLLVKLLVYRCIYVYLTDGLAEKKLAETVQTYFCWVEITTGYNYWFSLFFVSPAMPLAQSGVLASACPSVQPSGRTSAFCFQSISHKLLFGSYPYYTYLKMLDVRKCSESRASIQTLQYWRTLCTRMITCTSQAKLEKVLGHISTSSVVSP